MSEGGQAKKGAGSREQSDDEAETTTSTADQVDAKDLLDDVDELLDEIDDVLEENAEEFIKNYVQKGGE